MTARSIRVLVVDDEAAQRDILTEILSDAGYDVASASSGEAALSTLGERPVTVLLTDIRMPGLDGVALLARARALRPSIAVILMTAHATVSSAVAAMKEGAHDYLQKPFSKEELLQRVARASERARLIDENTRLRSELSGREAPDILGPSDAMERVRRLVERITHIPGDVLVTGESGTGKELVARHIHFRSERAAGPFVAVNCAAIPESLAESELFGHERGAFTSATSARVGRFEQADGGTLFLDEVSSMPIGLQPKLLRVLQERDVERVGGGRSRTVDVRVVSATNQDLRTLVASGRFREDLYHRLNVLEIHLPPLRQRPADVKPLMDVFLTRAAARFGVPEPTVSDALGDHLVRYAFPGNVRELKHLVEKMVALADGDNLDLGDLPPSMHEAGAPPPHALPAGDGGSSVPESLLADGPVSLVDIERRLLREAVRRADGNVSEAAKLLGISYKTMQYRVRKYGLDH